ESREKEKEPKATGPVPGSRTSSRTTIAAAVVRHQVSASAIRVSPRVSTRAATPQPTRPSPRRTQLTVLAASGRGRRSRRSPGSGIGTVRASSGERAGSPAGAVDIAVILRSARSAVQSDVPTRQDAVGQRAPPAAGEYFVYSPL